MDDDQQFVSDLVESIYHADAVDYRTIVTSRTDEGRNAVMTFQLYAGDKYVITIKEL